MSVIVPASCCCCCFSVGLVTNGWNETQGQMPGGGLKGMGPQLCENSCFLEESSSEICIEAMLVVTAVTWNVTPCSPVDVQHFGDICCLHHQCRRVGQVRNERCACFLACSLLDYF
jgi:hypothetical protein